MEELRAGLAPWYSYVKAIHVLSAAIWGFSTAVAWAFYLKPALASARRHPDDPTRRARRNELMERFDRGASFEHVALVVLVVTAVLMLWLGRVDLTQWSFITAMLWLGILVILPMEAVDIWLSHMGGSKAHAREDPERYERLMELHWIFFRITEPLVVILVPTMFVIAIAKPF